MFIIFVHNFTRQCQIRECQIIRGVRFSYHTFVCGDVIIFTVTTVVAIYDAIL